MYSKKIKVISALVMSMFFFSGCGVSESIDSAKSTASSLVSGSAETSELQILENLPKGTLAGASRATSGLYSKAEAILSLKQYLPKKIQEEINTEFPEVIQLELLNSYIGGLNISYVIRPKQEEILFASWGINPDRIATDDICAMGKGIVEKQKIIELVKKFPKFTEEKDMKEFLKNPDAKIDELFEKVREEMKNDSEFKKFSKYADIEFYHNKKNIIFLVKTKACNEEDTKILEEFSKKVNNQDRMSNFISVDKKFFTPFLTKGNLSIVKIGIEQGEKELFAEAEKKGFDVEKLKTLESEILDPWGRTNVAKMIQSFEKFSYVSGAINGNLLDREYELLVKFSDEDSAKLFEEIRKGAIPSKKMWLHDGAKMTAKVSRNGGTVYDYVKYENTEYPSALSSTASGGVVVIVFVGILATGATALYTSSQEKARDSMRISDLQVLKTGLIQFYAENNEKYPEDLEVLVESGYLNTIPRDPKYHYEYDYKVTADGQGFLLSADPESSRNIGSAAFEVNVNFDKSYEFGIKGINN